MKFETYFIQLDRMLKQWKLLRFRSFLNKKVSIKSTLSLIHKQCDSYNTEEGRYGVIENRLRFSSISLGALNMVMNLDLEKLLCHTFFIVLRG